jgi:predicted transcriptional regulator
MMTPIPDRILWCYGEYQTLYATVDGVDFHQGLPDLDTLDPREKHLIILDDLMDETDQRVAGIHLMRQGHDLRYVSRVFEDDHVMGIETYGSMVFSSMKQILNDVHDTDVVIYPSLSKINSVLREMRKQ